MIIIATCSYGQLEKICKALGLKNKGYVWKGTSNGKYIRVSIHTHSKGRSIPTGLFHRYLKDLGFDSVEEFNDFLKEL